MDLPVEVLMVVFSFLYPNDMIEISAKCKLFYHISRKNKLFVKNCTDSKKVFKEDKWWLCQHYHDMLFSLVNQLSFCLKDLHEDNLTLGKNVIFDELFYSILLFRVSNHWFLCNRSQHESNMCKCCTKMCIKHRKISDRINKKLFVQIGWYFPF